MRQVGPADGPGLRIGPHRYQIEEDLFHWQPRGEVLPDHARGVVAIVREIYKRFGYVLYLLDGRAGKPLGPDVRRIVVDGLRPLQGSLAMAAFGLSVIERTSGILVFSAARLLTGLDFPFKFVSTEAEARIFLYLYRNRRTQDRRGPSRVLPHA